MPKNGHIISILLLNIVLSFAISSLASCLTIDEAIAKAKVSFPVYKTSQAKVRSSKALYDATLGPYFPSVDASSSIARHYSSIDDFDQRIYDVTASYVIFDGGRRKSDRSISCLNLFTASEDLKKNLIDLVYNVKASFYTAIAQKEAVEQRKIQVEDAKKDYDIAQGRHKYGVAKLIDVLQASIRLEQARFNLIQSEGDYKNALSDLNSLIGEPLETLYQLEGSLDSTVALPDRKNLSTIALERPEIKQAEAAVQISRLTSDRNISEFFPVISISGSYSRSSGGSPGTVIIPEDRVAALKATWNLFDLGKFFKQKSANIDIEVSHDNLENVKRQVLLNVNKSYEDTLVSMNALKVARQQLSHAELNYSQSYGQYKIGTSDILTLVQAESLLANAREQLISSKLNAMLSRAQLERILGIENIETLARY